MRPRLELSLRDSIRIIPASLYAVAIAYVCAAAIGIHPRMFSSVTTITFITILIAIAVYITEMHKKLRPWKTEWGVAIKKLTHDIVYITKEDILDKEYFAKPVYKQWIEASYGFDYEDKSPVQVLGNRSHIHYATGLAYTITNISIISAVGAIAMSSFLILNTISMMLVLPDFQEFWRIDIIFNACILTILLFLFTQISKRHSLRLIEEACVAGQIAMRTESSKLMLRSLARAAAEIAQITERSEIDQVVKRVIHKHKPIAYSTIRSISEIEYVNQFDLRTDSKKRIGYLEIVSEDADKLVGGKHYSLYSGPIHQRLQLDISTRLCHKLGIDDFRLQVRHTKPLEHLRSLRATSAGMAKDPTPIDLQTALEKEVIPVNGVVHRCCEQYGIDFIVLLSGRIIGPSPAIAGILEILLTKHISPGNHISVYDPFSGTGLTQAVCSQLEQRIENLRIKVVGNDCQNFEGRLRDNKTKKPKADSNSFKQISEDPYDIVIIDPLYEDFLNYLHLAKPKLKYKYMVCQTGDDVDIGWNKAASQLLDSFGTKLQCDQINALNLYGKHIEVRVAP